MPQIRVRCLCPDPTTHPEGDTVTFPEKLDFMHVAICNKAYRWFRGNNPDAGVPEILAILSDAYLRHCLGSWTLVGPDPETGKVGPIPLTPANVERYLMADPDEAMKVSDACDDQYGGQVLAPLVRRASDLSSDTPTEQSMSPNPAGTETTQTTPSAGPRQTRKRSSPSSTTSSQTGSTGAMA